MTIQLASFSDIKSIIFLIKMRIKWMDQQGIKQWNKSNYLSTFTLEYFNEVIENNKQFIVRGINNQIVGAFTLFDEDSRWTDNISALYIHNFVSLINNSGLGDAIIEFCEDTTRQRGYTRLRIDCQKENKRLNEYYMQRGFEYISSFEEELYSGNRREKRRNN